MEEVEFTTDYVRGESEPDLPSMVRKTCDFDGCNNIHEVKRRDYLRFDHTYCSKRCYGLDFDGRGTWRIVICSNPKCGKRFRKRMSNIKRGTGTHYHDRECYLSHMADKKFSKDEYNAIRNDRRWFRYWNDPEYRERAKAQGRESQRKQREKKRAERSA